MFEHADDTTKKRFDWKWDGRLLSMEAGQYEVRSGS